MKKVLLRKDLQIEDQWDLTSIYKGEAEFEKELNSFLSKLSQERWGDLLNLRGKLNEGVEIVKKVADQSFEFDQTLSKLYTYCFLKHDEDLNHDIWKSFFQKVNFLYQDFFQSTAWIEPELLSLDQNAFEALMKEDSLKEYAFYLETLIHKKEFTLSSEKEELLSLSALPLSTPQKTFSLLNDVDLNFGKVLDSEKNEHELSHGTYRLFQRSDDPELRKNSFLQLHQKFQHFQNTFAELLMGHVQQHIFDIKARGYKSSLMAALYPKNIPVNVYHNLIQTVRSNLSTMHEYILVRKELLGLSEIHPYDLQPSPCKTSSQEIPYQTAVEWIVESVHPLGEEYQSALQKGLTSQRWVDRYENLHKRSGAYSSGCYGSHPYILMNYKGTLNDVFTLAHEAGHSMHTYLSNKNQPYVYSRYPIFVAEVASIFNESLLMHHLLGKNQTEENQLTLLHERIEELRATLFRQTMFAEFEFFIHDSLEKERPLTANSINEYYYGLNRDYYGPHMQLDKEISIEWARVPHFYSNFYVYQYATGISAALTLAKRVLEKEKGSKDAYLNFLKSGGHAYPIDLLKIAKIDMESKEPIETALGVFRDLVEKLKEASPASAQD